MLQEKGWGRNLIVAMNCFVENPTTFMVGNDTPKNYG